MKENISMGTAVLAIVISIIAITSTVLVKPVSTISAGSVSGNELADNSVTSSKVAPNTLTDEDISDNGISRIADNAITLLHLSPEVISMMTGETNVTAAIEDNSVTSAMIFDGTITDDDISDMGISKIADNAITLAHLTSAVIDAMTGVTDIADNSITSQKIMNGTIIADDLADASVTSEKIADDTITADDIEDRTQVISFPAHALNYIDTGGTITEYAIGLLWEADWDQGAYLILPGRLDWDGETDVSMSLHFRSGTSDSGDVQFFIRPRAYDDGDSWGDTSSITGDAVTVSAANAVYEQFIDIPASKFGSKELWVISIQRDGALSTYTDDIVLLSVSLFYNAVR